jgi:hypothetical protein
LNDDGILFCYSTSQIEEGLLGGFVYVLEGRSFNFFSGFYGK